MNDKLTALLMAGGSGTRLWPLSRPGRAKQFAALLSEKSMLEMTYERVRGLVPDERIFVNITAGNEHWVHKLLPQLPRENVISAPADRDTLPTLGFATLSIERKVSAPTMILLASDNWIGDVKALEARLVEAAAAAESGPFMVSVGIRPDHASTQYGYMHCGEKVFGEGTYVGLGYHEKPDLPRAERYFKDGAYDWNSGMFVWTATAFWEAVRDHAPREADIFEELRAADPNDRDRISHLFSRLARIAVDHGVLEHLGPDTNVQHRFTRAEVPWDDVGRYTALANHLPDRGGGNRVRGDAELHGVTDSIVLVSSDRKAQIEGVSDLIVCVDGDDVLVAHRGADGRVREVADQPAFAGVVPAGNGALERSDSDAFDNSLTGFVKVIDSSRCIVEGKSPGVIALLGVEAIRVEVAADTVTVTKVTDARSTLRAHEPPRFPRVLVDPDRASMSLRVARELVATLRVIGEDKAHPTIVLSAGKTPEIVYEILRGPLLESVEWRRFTLLQMDDYAGMSPDDPASFNAFLRRELVTPLGIGTFVGIDGTWNDESLSAHEARAQRSGIDLILHGVGENGHLGFNEPGAAWDSKARKALLAPATRAASAAGFGGIDRTPTHGLTLGLDLLNRARRVFVVASSEKKASAIGDGFLNPPNAAVPVSSLQHHKDVTLFLDRGAAARFYA